MEFGSRLAISDPWLARVARTAEATVSDADMRSLRVESIPDGTMTLLYRRTSSSTGEMSISGPRSRALFKTTDAVPMALSIRFAPGEAKAILGLPAHVLTDRIVRLEDVWGADARPLLDALLDANDAHASLRVLTRALRARASSQSPSSSARLARRAVLMLETRPHQPRCVDTIATALGVSARHLRRVFFEYVGLGPKELNRIVRLQRIVRLRRSARSWAEIAPEAGYYDQAHLIDDFRDLMGVTPGVFERRDTLLPWSRCVR